MTKIIGFLSGIAWKDDGPVYTAVAITDKGKWIAGSVSQSPENARRYLEGMARRFSERLSGPWVFEWRSDGWADPVVLELAAKAFETMP